MRVGSLQILKIMAKYLSFETLKSASLGTHQVGGTVGKHKLEIVSIHPQRVQVRGHFTGGEQTNIVTLAEGQTLGYDGGKIWVVKPYAGNDPVRKLLNEHHLPKDFVEYLPLEDLFQDGDNTEEYRDWSCISGKVTVTVWPNCEQFDGDIRYLLPKRINAVYQEVSRHGNTSQGYRKLVVAHGTDPQLICEALYATELFWKKHTWDSETKSAAVRPEYKHLSQ
jgi:hypothetical protein